MREASRGGHADYFGITYEKIDKNMGIFWPCPTLDHPGTPRLFEDGRSFHEDGKHRFVVTEWRESGDPVSVDFPIYLTTGRVVSQYLSGTQTRRIGALVDQYPNPRLEIHPRLAEQYQIKDGDWVTIGSRRDEITLQAMVVKTIRPDTVFIPYHWAGKRSANKLTHRTLDPRSKIPEFKVSACQLRKAEGPPDWAASANGTKRGKEGTKRMHGYEFYVDPSRCIGCQSCVDACGECETHRGHSMINFDFIDRQGTTATAAYVCWHCEEPTCAMVCPADAIKKGDDGIVQSSLKPRCIGCSNCVLACPFGIPKIFPEYEQMMKCDMCYDRTSVGKKPMCATVCPSQALSYVRAEEIAKRREKPTNVFQFGNQKIVTQVYMMVPAETDAVSLDVLDYMWEESYVAFSQPQ